MKKIVSQMLSLPECMPWITVGLAECVAIVTLNFITIIVFIKNRNLRKRSTYLLINLAVVDMLAGGAASIDLFYHFGGYYCNLWKWYSSKGWVNYVLFTLPLLLPVASVINITAIALERLNATFRPFRQRIIKKWNYGLIIAVVWVTAVLLFIATIVLIKFKRRIYYFYIRNAFNLICLLIICISYASILMKVRCGAQPQHHGAASRERKLTMTLLIMTAVSLLLYLPDAIFYFLDSTNPMSKLVHARLHGVLNFLFFANSLVNPILYTARMPEFRRALVALFHRRPQQRNQVEVIPLRDM